ncbi:MAG: hypothetical protein HY303_20195 [Candidatus Wallbacteria bacterium]|nr:hypothetical protein [Candidatus Wallbacteria bacterium]
MLPKRGIATVVVFFVLLVLTIGVFSYFSFMRGRRLLQYRQLFGEFAYSLARAALELSRAEVEQGLLDPKSAISASLMKAMDDPLWASGKPVPLGEIDYMTDYRPLIDRVANSFEGGVANIATLKTRYYALPDDSLAFDPYGWTKGLQDVRQKYGRLFIEVESVFKPGALVEGVTKKLLGYMEYRVVSPLLPVFNHFTLFLSDPTNPNCVPADINSAHTDFHGLVSDGHSPLVLTNGDVDDASAFKGITGDTLARQGWCYLGARGDLVLNHAFSHDETDNAGQAGEDFLFYHESTDPAVKESQRAYADDEVNAKLPQPAFWEIRFWDMGVSRMDCPELDGSRKAFGTPDVTQKFLSSVLHLEGAPRNRVSPTLVFGKVSAGFLRLTAANPKGAPDNTAFKAFFTLLPTEPMPLPATQLRAAVPVSAGTLNDIAAAADQYAPGKFLYVNPADRTMQPAPLVPDNVYSQMMSRVATRPYNQGLLFLSSEGHQAFPVQKGVTVAKVPKEFFAPKEDADPRMKIPNDLLPEQEQTGLNDPELESVLASLATSFPDPLKTCRMSRDATNPTRFLEREGYLVGGDTLDLGTVLVWEKEGPFPLGAINHIKRGGVLVADEFDLASPLVGGDGPGDPTKPPLMLVARKGNIRIADRHPVQAILVAPKGLIEAPKGLQLFGSIVAQGIDFQKSFQTKNVSFLHYNSNFKVGPWLKTSKKLDPGWSLCVDHSGDFIMVQ